MHSENPVRVVVVGAGPAGLTAAYELQVIAGKYKPVVLEASHMVGGISRTECHNGNRFDIGGHRFFTKVPEVEAFWYEILGDDFITVRRRSRIFYRGRFFDYPLRVTNALLNIGLYETFRIILSYAKWKVRPHKSEETFEEWVINRFGGRLYMHFFRNYTEKVWGIPPEQIRADWAAQRIKNLSLWKAIWNAVSGANNTTSLIDEFQYPRLGPGMMWERTRDKVLQNGGEVWMGAEVYRVNRSNSYVTSVDIKKRDATGAEIGTERIEGDYFINSMALRDLINAFDPPPPPEVRDAANRLKYRDFLIVTLILDHPDPFPDNWIYVHSLVKVGRIQNFRAWSPEMLANENNASIGMEYFCQINDDIWNMSDDALCELACAEIEELGLCKKENVIDFAVIRQPKAYPVYDSEYKESVETLKKWLAQFENFQTAGRNGLHCYNNQDHSMLSAIYAARNIVNKKYNVWDVNVDRSYHEDFEVSKTE